MKKNKDKYSFYTLIIIIITMIIGGWDTCQAQESEKEYPQKIILEMELEQVVKLKIPKELKKETTDIKQKYPPKTIDNVCLPENKVNIPKTNAIIKEEEYDENNK